MVVVTGVTLLLGLCAVSIQVLMKLNGFSQGRYAESVAVERLGRHLRDDAHASRTAAIKVDAKNADRAASLRLLFEPEHTVVYDCSDSAVVRTESRGGKTVRHERFSLARGTGARFELRELASRKLVALVLTRPPGKSQAEPPRPLELLALQGKDPVVRADGRGDKP
jgi:hypothetical protein